MRYRKQEGMEGRQRGGDTRLQAGKFNQLLFALQHYLKAAIKFRDPFWYTSTLLLLSSFRFPTAVEAHWKKWEKEKLKFLFTT